MDFIYFINSSAVIIYGFFFGMSLMWWIDYYVNNNSKNIKNVNNNENYNQIYNEIKFIKIQLDIFTARMAILDKEYKKLNKQS